MTKCDFCKCYDPRTRSCSSYTGSSACEQAAKTYFNFMRGNRTHTKNVNVNKTTRYKKR